MKVSTTVLVLLSSLSAIDAFSPSLFPSTRSSLTVVYGYVPDGFKTAAEYQKFLANEKKKTAARNLGGLGPRGFKSRSMQSFQEAMERGEADHLMPVFNAKEKIAKGVIRPEDIPYMQRGGSWDNTDIKGAKNKKKWLASDKQYAAGGYRKEQSVSIFGQGAGLDWTGKQTRRGPESAMGAASKFSRNYKAPNVNDLRQGSSEKPKKLFGLF